MNRIMLNNTVLLRRIDTDDSKTEAGIIKPEVAQVRSNRGEVLAACADETEIKVGDIVVFTRYGGTDVEVDGQELIIVSKKQLYWVERSENRYQQISKLFDAARANGTLKHDEKGNECLEASEKV